MSPRVKVGLGAAVGLALFGLASVVHAEPASLRDFLFGVSKNSDASLPMVARYQSERGEGFILDRSDW